MGRGSVIVGVGQRVAPGGEKGRVACKLERAIRFYQGRGVDRTVNRNRKRKGDRCGAVIAMVARVGIITRRDCARAGSCGVGTAAYGDPVAVGVAKLPPPVVPLIRYTWSGPLAVGMQTASFGGQVGQIPKPPPGFCQAAG